MNLTYLFTIITLCVTVKGAWWAAAVNPVILSLGAIFGAVDLDVLDVQSIQWKSWMPFINKYTEKEQESKDRLAKANISVPDEDAPIKTMVRPKTEQELKDLKENLSPEWEAAKAEQDRWRAQKEAAEMAHKKRREEEKKAEEDKKAAEQKKEAEEKEAAMEKDAAEQRKKAAQEEQEADQKQ